MSTVGWGGDGYVVDGLRMLGFVWLKYCGWNRRMGDVVLCERKYGGWCSKVLLTVFVMFVGEVCVWIG